MTSVHTAIVIDVWTLECAALVLWDHLTDAESTLTQLSTIDVDLSHSYKGVVNMLLICGSV